MCPAGFALARLAGEAHYVGAVLPLSQAGKGCFDFRHVGKPAQPARAAAQLPRRLGAAQKEFAYDAQFLRRELQRPKWRVAEQVLVFGHAVAIAALFADEALLGQLIDELLHRCLVQVEHRVAVALLVAGVGERVQRQGILFRGGDFLFDQAADDAGFVEGEL